MTHVETVAWLRESPFGHVVELLEHGFLLHPAFSGTEEDYAHRDVVMLETYHPVSRWEHWAKQAMLALNADERSPRVEVCIPDGSLRLLFDGEGPPESLRLTVADIAHRWMLAR